MKGNIGFQFMFYLSLVSAYDNLFPSNTIVLLEQCI